MDHHQSFIISHPNYLSIKWDERIKIGERLKIKEMREASMQNEEMREARGVQMRQTMRGV